MEGTLVGRLSPKPREPFDTPAESRKALPGIACVDDNGFIRVRKLRPSDPEYSDPDTPAEAKE